MLSCVSKFMAATHCSSINRWCYRRACCGMKESCVTCCTHVFEWRLGSPSRCPTIACEPSHDSATPSSLDLTPPGSRPASPIWSTTVCCCQTYLRGWTHYATDSGCSISLLLSLFRCRGTAVLEVTYPRNLYILSITCILHNGQNHTRVIRRTAQQRRKIHGVA